MIFGCLGELPLGGWPVSTISVAAPRGASFKRRGKKWEIPERVEPPDWETSLPKAREALWQKRYDEEIAIRERDENLQKAWSGLLLKFAEDDRKKPLKEIRRVYYDRLPEHVKRKMAETEGRVNAWRFAQAEEERHKKEKIVEETRNAALRLANEAKQREKERQEVIYKQRVKSLKKARKAKRRKNES